MTYRDEFDEPPRGKNGFFSTVGPKAAFFIVLIALSFMVGMVWKLYVGAGASNDQSVPIVRADDNPFAVTPDDPGGMEIPHKDSTIFSTLKSSREDDENKIENLLAEDNNEDPLPRSQLFAGLNTEKNENIDAPTQGSPLDKPMGENAQDIALQLSAETSAVIDELVEGGTASVMPPLAAPREAEEVVEPEEAIPDAIIAPKKVEVAPQPEPEPAFTPTAVVKAEPKPEPVATPTPAHTPAPTSSTGGYYVQLASVRSAEGAESEWKKLQSKYNVLSGFSKRVERADLGAKGVFYRIQAGPVSKDKADSTCDAIKKISPNGCLVKKN